MNFRARKLKNRTAPNQITCAHTTMRFLEHDGTFKPSNLPRGRPVPPGGAFAVLLASLLQMAGSSLILCSSPARVRSFPSPAVVCLFPDATAGAEQPIQSTSPEKYMIRGLTLPQQHNIGTYAMKYKEMAHLCITK